MPLECAMCSGSLQTADAEPVTNFCGHLFHKLCIMAWLKSYKTCPVCQKKCSVAGLITLHIQDNDGEGKAADNSKGQLHKVLQEIKKQEQIEKVSKQDFCIEQQLTEARDKLTEKLEMIQSITALNETLANEVDTLEAELSRLKRELCKKKKLRKSDQNQKAKTALSKRANEFDASKAESTQTRKSRSPPPKKDKPSSG